MIPFNYTSVNVCALELRDYVYRSAFIVPLIFLFVFSFFSHTASAQIYKYQDANGKWVFSDKKPEQQSKAAETKIETVKIDKTSKEKVAPHFVVERIEEENQVFNQLTAINPYFAPVQMRVYSDQFKQGRNTKTVPADSGTVFLKTKANIDPYTYKWTLGAPKKTHDDSAYAIPVRSAFSHKITQGFNGKFSHKHPSSKYAVDIAMQVGTYLVAARAGRVIWTKDDYHMSGRTRYFLDKANYVKVLHEDGTYAVYAHILQGTLAVKPGDYVDVGQRLARSGSSGFSTGPHLHFVIRRNAGMKTLAVPFKFGDSNGGRFKPTRGMMVRGFKP